MAKKNDGVSLRTVNILLIAGAVIMSALVFFSTYSLSTGFRRLADVSEQQIELRKAVRELTDASDYLTEQVQRFAIMGDRQFLDAYFDEALKEHHREEALARMAAEDSVDVAYDKLQAAMNASVSLMEREYYAMRLVIDAKHISGYPEILRSVKLSDEDRSLTPEEKMRHAAELVFDEAYYEQKDHIRIYMRASLDALEKMAYDRDASALDTLRSELAVVRIVIVLQAAAAVFLFWATSRLGIHPILNAVDRIKENDTIPEVGANEFRYLARTYNKMYEVYKKSLEHLNFKASHDELTGVYNRAGYDLLLDSIDLKSTYMILFDVDNFKSINDTYGHEIGDKVLVKLVQVLKNNFRNDDYICRIGGDEFVVFMVHTSEKQNDLIAEKIDRINRDLEQTGDGLPPTSISVGITHGSAVDEPDKLFEKTDAAMYDAKRKGKRRYTFAKK